MEKNKLILKLTRVNEDGTKETLCNEELSSVAILGECFDNESKLMEVLAQTSINDLAGNIAHTQQIIKAARVAVMYGAITRLMKAHDADDGEDPENKLAELINREDEE